MSLFEFVRAITRAERKGPKNSLRTHSSSRARRRLLIETLEDRTVPSSTALLVKDINLAPLSSFPAQPVNVNGTLYFTADDGIHGTELWKSDGTAAGTTLVKDIVPGNDSSGPSQLTAVGDRIFFTAFTPETSYELWVSDGTEAGTVLLKDIWPGQYTSQVSQMTAVGGTLFFSANDIVHSTELWKSDGTVEGTVLVKDISTTPIPYGGTSSYPYSLVDFGGTLFFSAFTPETGNELWKSDGTEEGTVLVKDIFPGSSPYGYGGYIGNGSGPAGMTAVGGTLFFSAFTPDAGIELWKTDGTEEGTVLVRDIYPGTSYDYSYGYVVNGSGPSQLTDVGGTLFFTALTAEVGTELWKSDGTEEGTVLVKDVNTTPSPYGNTYTSSPYELTAVGGKLFFTAEVPAIGRELWVSDGTEAGTTVVRDIRPGATDTSVHNLTASGNTLFFTADDGISGNQLWKSDGTEADTTTVKVIASGSVLGNLGDVNGTVYFTAFEPATGFELWKSDGTAAGTVLVKDVNTNTISASINRIAAVGKTVFFTASTFATGAELWKSDGTAEGTVLVKDINPGAAGSSPSYLTNVNGTLFFTAFNPATGKELWKSDGTAEGTVLVKDIVPGSNGSYSTELTAVGDTLFLGGGALWKSDGTAAGTTVVKDGVSFAFHLTNVAGTLFFTAFQPATGSELWKSDGTAAGTVLVKDINPGPNSTSVSDMAAVGSTLFLSAFEPSTGVELWRSDGTAAGTVLVKDINSGAAHSRPANLTAVSGSLFFTAFQRETGEELWNSDGTEAGTFLVKDINTGTLFGQPAGSNPRELTDVGGVLFFSALNQATNGAELWRSDGTEAGTVLVKDTSPRPFNPTELTAIGNKVYFRAIESESGAELWESDGTPEGTVLVRDIWPGTRNSFPFNLTAVGRALFFTADDGIHGHELWFAATSVSIDVKPGASPNRINLNANGNLPVAVLSTSDFNAANFDPADRSRIRLGDANSTARVAPVRFALEDVDGDGDLDLLLFFSMRQLRDSGALTASTTSLELRGFLADNAPFVGLDSVEVT